MIETLRKLDCCQKYYINLSITFTLSKVLVTIIQLPAVSLLAPTSPWNLPCHTWWLHHPYRLRRSSDQQKRDLTNYFWSPLLFCYGLCSWSKESSSASCCRRSSWSSIRFPSHLQMQGVLSRYYIKHDFQNALVHMTPAPNIQEALSLASLFVLL